MSFSDWFIIGGTALLLRSSIKKAAAKRTEDEQQIVEITGNTEKCEQKKTYEQERERREEINKKRRDTPCYFSDGLSSDDFVATAKRAGKKIRRIKDITVSGAIIFCNVESQTGYSDWSFSVDFNDWGHVTGTYWKQTDNYDSAIPDHYGKMVSGIIHDFWRERNIELPDLSDYVDENKELRIENGLNYCVKNLC